LKKLAYGLWLAFLFVKMSLKPQDILAAQKQAQQWRPQEPGIRELVELVNISRANDTEKHKQVYAILKRLERSVEFSGYLVYIFCDKSQQDVEIRLRAGLLLRNNIKTNWGNTPLHIREVIKLAVRNSLGEEHRILRKTLGSIVATMLTETLESGMEIWPTVFEELSEILRTNSSSPAHIDAVLDIFLKVITDLDTTESWGPYLDCVVPLMNDLMGHQNPDFREQALAITYQLIFCPPPSFRMTLEQTVEGVFRLMQDPTPKVRTNVCKCSVQLLERYPETVAPYIDHIIKFHIRCTADENELISLEAAEFWSTYVNHEGTDKDKLEPYISQLVPVLLNNMIYSAEELAEKSLMNDQANVDDRPDDVKPEHHRFKGEDSEPMDEGLEDTNWTIRKCSARSLDHLGCYYGSKLLTCLLPLIEKLLKSKDWRRRESGILAIGAVGVGCAEAITPFLPNLVPYLIQLMNDEHVLIRSMACWSTARFCRWMFGDEQNLCRFLEFVLERILDDSKMVQNSACAALSELLEVGQARLNPYIEALVNTVSQAFSKYKQRNMGSLYDVCITLCYQVPSLTTALPNAEDESKREQLLKKLVEPVLRQFLGTDQNDQRIYGILDTLVVFSSSMTLKFAPYLKHIVPKIVGHSNAVIEEIKQTKIETLQQKKSLKQRKQFLVADIDFLCSVVEGQGVCTPNHLPIKNMLEILFYAVNEEDQAVRRSAFALLGDLYHYSSNVIIPHNEKFMGIALKNVNPLEPLVCINALWTLGEAIDQLKENSKQYIQDIVFCVARVLQTEFGQYERKRVKDNAAIIMSRVGMYFPDDVAKYVTEFKTAWIRTLTHYPEDEEKAKGFRGLLLVIEKNVKGFCSDVEDMASLVVACTTWQNAPGDLVNMFRTLIKTLQSGIKPEEWVKVRERVHYLVPTAYQHNFRDYGLA